MIKVVTVVLEPVLVEKCPVHVSVTDPDIMVVIVSRVTAPDSPTPPEDLPVSDAPFELPPVSLPSGFSLVPAPVLFPAPAAGELDDTELLAFVEEEEAEPLVVLRQWSGK